MQLVDELSMIYTTCLMMYASFAYTRSRHFATILGLGLLALSAFITVSAWKLEASLQPRQWSIGVADMMTAVLSLHQRSCLPSSRVRGLDGNCGTPQHVGHGIATPPCSGIQRR
jgi:hypothetical protein